MIERERKYGMPTVDLRFSENVKPGRSTSAFVAKNYNVNTKLVGDSVKPYRPTTTFINRHEQYEDAKEDKDEFTIGRHDESVPTLDKKKKDCERKKFLYVFPIIGGPLQRERRSIV